MRTLVDDPALAARVIRDISPPALPVPADATDPVLKELAEDGYSTVVRLPLRRGKRGGGAEAGTGAPRPPAHHRGPAYPAAGRDCPRRREGPLLPGRATLGVDRHFGGDPAHLDTTLATMPDTATGERRHFLVLYDRLPGAPATWTGSRSPTPSATPSTKTAVRSPTTRETRSATGPPRRFRRPRRSAWTARSNPIWRPASSPPCVPGAPARTMPLWRRAVRTVASCGSRGPRHGA